MLDAEITDSRPTPEFAGSAAALNIDADTTNEDQDLA
jgi:hypothetical protein